MVKFRPLVVERVNNAIYRINHYPGDKCHQNQLDSVIHSSSDQGRLGYIWKTYCLCNHMISSDFFYMVSDRGKISRCR